MKYLSAILFLVICSGTAYPQIREFDNSRPVLPWLYNPSADFSEDFQAYFGYDGRGKSSFTPQSLLAGARMPVFQGKKARMRRGRTTTFGMVGLMVMNTSQEIFNDLKVNINYSQQVALNRKTKLAMGLGAGIINLSYDYENLEYMDQQDPLLNGESYFNFYLNAGLSLTMDERFFINLAAPYIMKNDRINIEEIVLRTGYSLYINEDVNLIAAAHLDTYNNNLIYGGDLRMEIRKMVSVFAGADRYKYYGGLILDYKPISFGYTFGRNFNNLLNNINSHQIILIGSIPIR
jgi:hypothetical protein